MLFLLSSPFSRHGRCRRHGGSRRCRRRSLHGRWRRCGREEELQLCHLSCRHPSCHAIFPDEGVFRQLSESHLLLADIPVVWTFRHAIDIEVQVHYGLRRRRRHYSLVHGLRLFVRLAIRLLRLTIGLLWLAIGLLRLAVRLLRLAVRLLPLCAFPRWLWVWIGGIALVRLVGLARARAAVRRSTTL